MKWFHWVWFVVGLFVAYGLGQYRMGKHAYALGQVKGAEAERARIRALWRDKLTKVRNLDMEDREYPFDDVDGDWMDKDA